MFGFETCRVNNNSRSDASKAPETFTCAKTGLLIGDATVVASFFIMLALVLFAVVGMWLVRNSLNLLVVPVIVLTVLVIITFIIMCHTFLASRTPDFTTLT